jgi:ketosteroid isomerase-like protein
MRCLPSVLAAVVLFGSLASAHPAGEDDQLKAIMDAHLNAINTAQSAEIARHHLPGHSEFGTTGAKLGVSGNFDVQFARNEAIFGGGFTFDWHNEDLRIQVFGNTAIVAGYVVGTTTAPDGTVTHIRNRRTTVLIKTDGAWKEIHVHNSPLLTSD